MTPRKYDFKMADNNNKEANRFPKLKEKQDYQTWVVPMRVSLRLDDLWKYVVDGKDAEKYSLRRDEVAQSRIELAVEPSIYTHINGLKSVKEI